MYALYKGNTYECSMSHLRGTIKLLSRTPQEGFKQGLSGYVKQVEKGECDRIFRKGMMEIHTLYQWKVTDATS